MRRLTIIIVIILFISIIIYLLRKIIENKIYRPNNKHIELKAIPYKDIYLNTKNKGQTWAIGPPLCDKKDEYINVWYLKKYPGNDVVLYFHGNSDNISYRQYMIDICEILDLNLLLVDYRGYGKSDGEVTPKSVIEDAETSYNFLLKYFYPNQIIIWGESLGGTPALWIAANKKIKCVLLLSTFSRLHKFTHPYLRFILKLIIYDINIYTDNISFIKKVKYPILICHSKDDDLIPYTHATELLATATSSKKQLLTITGGHLSPNFTRESFSKIVKFIRPENAILSDNKLDYAINIIKQISDIN